MNIQGTEIERFTRAVLERKGVPSEDARIVADCLLTANLSGIDSHGVVRLAHYVHRLERGSINPAPRITIERRAPAVLHVDGEDGFGHVVACRAARAAAELCREQGTATAAIGRSSHFGPASYFLQEAVAAGLAGMAMTHTDALVVPHGAARRFVGTNPVAFGFPAPGAPFMLDISTSTVAYGKIALAQTEDRPIPRDWALDASGRPTTDPHTVDGMHPMAQHKGSGLALAIDVFCALLTGMPYGPHINRMYHEFDEPRRLGHFLSFWDISRFVPLDEFTGRIGQMIEELHGLPLFAGFERVYYPGEPEGERRAERRSRGIPVEQGLFRELCELGRRLGVDPPTPIAGGETGE
ncbi:MAG: Ldh family oxidoreductase [Spirochaetales bacterium]|nr:Ldh family oxidoreductase [Spirochaetales bacterium]